MWIYRGWKFLLYKSSVLCKLQMPKTMQVASTVCILLCNLDTVQIMEMIILWGEFSEEQSNQCKCSVWNLYGYNQCCCSILS